MLNPAWQSDLIGQLADLCICFDTPLSALWFKVSWDTQCSAIKEGLSHLHILVFSSILSNSNLTETAVAATQSVTSLLPYVPTRGLEHRIHTCFWWGKVRFPNINRNRPFKDYCTLFKHTTPKLRGKT